MQIELPVTKNFEVKYLLANMNIRHLEDAEVNGVDEDSNSPKMPLLSGDTWQILIDVDTGQIQNWPSGVAARTHYKVCDAGVYHLFDMRDEEVASKDGYVPACLAPDGGGYGDYVILDIDGQGYISNWDPSSIQDHFNDDDWWHH